MMPFGRNYRGATSARYAGEDRSTRRFEALLDRHGLGEIARLIDVSAARHRRVVREEL